MSTGKRIAANTYLAACAIAVFAIIAVSILRSDWLKDRIREKIVSSVERVSGGRVELGAINYNWGALALTMNNFVIHGTEPSDAAPLVRVDSIHVGLTIVSVLKRDIDIRSLVVDHPEINLVFDKNGQSNLPPATHFRVEDANLARQFLNLRVKRYQIKNGTVQVNLQRFPLNVEGSSLAALLAYDSRHHSYTVHFSSHNTSPWPPAFAHTPVDVAMDAQLQQNRIAFKRLALRSPDSAINARGYLNNFADPTAALDMNASLAASDVAGPMRMPGWKTGQIAVYGEALYDRLNSFQFKGHVVGDNIAYSSSAFAVARAQISSSLEANRERAALNELHVRALQGEFTGRLLTDYGQFQLSGDLKRISLHEALSATLHPQMPWDALISGPVRFSASMNKGRLENAVAHAALQMDPGGKGTPLSGSLDAAYQQSGAVATISSAHLFFGATEVLASGVLGKSVQLKVKSSNLQDLQPALSLLHGPGAKIALPILLPGGNSQFAGTVNGPIANPRIAGALELNHFLLEGGRWTRLQTGIDLSASALRLASFSVERNTLRAKGSLEAALTAWRFHQANPLSLDIQFAGVNLPELVPQYFHTPPSVVLGLASGAVKLNGSLTDPRGHLDLALDNIVLYGEHVNRIQFHAAALGDTLHMTDGHLEIGASRVSFSGAYKHNPETWSSGIMSLRGDTNNLRLGTLVAIHRFDPTLDADLQVHGAATAKIYAGHYYLEDGNGSIAFQNITAKHTSLGGMTIDAAVHEQVVNAKISGLIRKAPVNGAVQMQMVGDLLTRGSVNLGRMDFSALDVLWREANLSPSVWPTVPFNGYFQGSFAFEGPMLHPLLLRTHAQVDHLQLKPRTETKAANFLLENEEPILLDAANGRLTISSFNVQGPDTRLSLAGSVPYFAQQSFNLKAGGSIDLALIRLFSPDFRASGECQISATVSGTLHQPKLDGLVQIRRGLFYPNDNNLPDGLSSVSGTIKFNGNRATIERLTARSGGGEVSAAGFITFGNNAPIVYRLEAQATGVRIRYAGGISVTGNSNLHLTGTSANSLVSGTTMITKITLNPNTDIGSLFATSTAPTPTPVGRQDFVSGLQLDIHIESAANMQVNTTLGQDIEADIDLRLRGKPSYPSLLGTISANQGTIKLFGATYTINRGQVSFTTPVKIDPVLDLDLQTQAHGISVDIVVSGTPGRLNINYRSDPPLQPRDIIALLAVGRAPDITAGVPNAQVNNDLNSLQSGANSVLGQALAPVSNRLSKLFGITNIKIDPLVQGIANAPQARLTLQQQISRDISVTYVTNLAQTSEQIFRFEWALNRQYSLVALRDDNGEFGIDIQYKKQFK